MEYFKVYLLDNPLLIFLMTILIVDMFCSFRFYYLKKYYFEINRKLDLERLEYLKKVVIYGYKILSSEENINEAIEKYRELEKELQDEEFDFSSYKNIYHEQLKKQ